MLSSVYLNEHSKTMLSRAYLGENSEINYPKVPIRVKKP